MIEKEYTKNENLVHIYLHLLCW